MFYLPKPVLRAANVGGGATQVRPAELQADAIACESLVNSSDREQLSVAEDILTAAGEKNHVASHRQPQLVPSVARSWCSWQSALQLEPTAAAAAKPTSVQPAATPAEAQERGEAWRGAIEAQLARARQLAQAQLTKAARSAAVEAQAAAEAEALAARPLVEETALALAVAQVRLARLPASERGTSTLLNEVKAPALYPSSSPSPVLSS